MWIASISRSPVTFDFFTFSEPPRSHKHSVERTLPSPSPVALPASASVSMIREACDDRSAHAGRGAPLRLVGDLEQVERMAIRVDHLVGVPGGRRGCGGDAPAGSRPRPPGPPCAATAPAASAAAAPPGSPSCSPVACACNTSSSSSSSTTTTSSTSSSTTTSLPWRRSVTRSPKI